MTYNKIAAPAKLFRIMFLIAFIMYRIVIAYLLVYYNITFIRVYLLQERSVPIAATSPRTFIAFTFVIMTVDIRRIIFTRVIIFRNT